MRFRRDKTEPPIIRPIPALLALAAGVGLSTAIAWASSTEVGQTTSTPVNSINTPIVAVSTVAGTPSYVTPDGVLTRWRFHSSSDVPAGGIRLKIFRFIEYVLPMHAKYEFVAESSFKALAPDTSYEFHERISVKEGDLLGLLAQGAKIEISAPGTDNKIGQFGAGDLPVGTTGTTTTEFPNSRVSVAATVESDADKDGFGDDTQDKCPSDPDRQDPPCAASTADKPTSVVDKSAPKLTLGGPTKQKLGSSVIVAVTCNEACSIAGNGSVSTSKPGTSKRLSLERATLALPTNTSGKLKLKLSKKSRRKIKRVLGGHGKATATVNVTAKDAAGNATVATRRIKLRT